MYMFSRDSPDCTLLVFDGNIQTIAELNLANTIVCSKILPNCSFYCQILNWNENTRKCTFTEWDVAYRRKNQLRCNSDAQDENQGTSPHFLSHICIWQTQGNALAITAEGKTNVETHRGIITLQKLNSAMVQTLVPPVNSDSSLYSFIVYSLSSLLSFFFS